MDITTIFITGLFAGGLTCLAVQGGLLANSIAHQQPSQSDTQTFSSALPVVSFLIARLFAYTLFGFALGWLGEIVQPSLATKVVFQFAVALFMIGTALNMLNIHPIFRYFVIQPPKSLMKIVRNQSKSEHIFGPAILGACTVFIPCGATQAMMAYAMTTGSALTGAVTMFTFILGTSPLFFILGYSLRTVQASARANLNTITAIALILLALYNMNGALSLSGYTLTPSNVSSVKTSTDVPVVTSATIYFTPSGYITEPAAIYMKGGSSVRIKLVNKDGAGCIQAFTIPSLGIQRVIPVGSTDEIQLTIPKGAATLPFMCSMGMYRGTINIL